MTRKSLKFRLYIIRKKVKLVMMRIGLIKPPEERFSSEGKLYVTLGWDFHPTSTRDGRVLPREAEMILFKEYYPNRKAGEWLVDPATGERLPIWKRGMDKEMFKFVSQRERLQRARERQEAAAAPKKFNTNEEGQK